MNDIAAAAHGLPEARVNSVRNALIVLRRLASAEAPEGVNAIARSTGISPSSCFNILKTLAADEFAIFDPRRKTYTLGPGMVDLAIAALDPETGFGRARSAIEALAQDHGVTVCLWRQARERLILIGAAEGPGFASIRFKPGVRMPLGVGSMSRCVAAWSHWDEAAMDAATGAVAWHARPSLRQYAREVRLAADLGYAIDDGAYTAGLTSVAAPVLDAGGALTHCVVATTFKDRLDKSGLRDLGSAVRAAAQALAPLLGSTTRKSA